MPDRAGHVPGPVLVLAPTGRDADGAGLLLGREGIAWRACPDLDALVAVLGDAGTGVGAVLVADEALARADLEPLARLLASQPPWSDLPFVVLTQNGAAARRALAERRLPEVLGNVVFLERPLNALTLLSAVRSALRARTRQRQVAAYLEEREGRAEALRESEAALRALNETLEARVAERTAELQQALDALHAEALERGRTEEQLHQAQKMEAVGQLTGGIAHDFNNMLQGVSGSLDMVRRRIAQGRAAEVGRYMDAAAGAVERAAGLTHRLLAFARRQALDPKHVEPDSLVQGLAELIRRTVGPQVELALDLGDGKWSVLCDPNQLESVLLNLAINARDAMPEGGRLRIATRDVRLMEGELAGQEGAGPGEYVEFLVADTGTGMTPDVLAHAFEPFFTTKPAGQGTGLGLSQIYGFVQQSDGIIRLDSAPGRGTTVRMFLPRFLVEPDAPEEGEAAEQPSATGGTILLVEDEAGVRALVAEALAGLGYDVLEAGDAAVGLRTLRAQDGRVDLLLTDVGLPGLNGRQFADAARELVPGLPVLLITGYAGPALQDWQLAPGMEVVAKPFKLDALAARVAAMLGQGAAQGTGQGAGQGAGAAAA